MLVLCVNAAAKKLVMLPIYLSNYFSMIYGSGRISNSLESQNTRVLFVLINTHNCKNNATSTPGTIS